VLQNAPEFPMNSSVTTASRKRAEHSNTPMRPQLPQPANVNRIAMGLLAIVCWVTAVTLFGRHAIALQESLSRERWFLGGAGGIMCVTTFVLVAKILKRNI